MAELLVATRKGLFVLEGEPGGPFETTARAFAGDAVERDAAAGAVDAALCDELVRRPDDD